MTDPADIDARLRRALDLLRQGRPAEAETAARQAVEASGGAAVAYNALGAILDRRGRDAEALQAFEEAEAADPRLRPATLNRAVLLIRLGRADEAVAPLEGLLAAGETAASVSLNLSTALMRTQAWHKASAVCLDGLTRHPADPGLLTNLANTLDMTSKLDGAMKVVNRLAKAAKALPVAHVMRARLLRRMGKADQGLKALAALDGARLSPTDALEAAWEKAMVLDAIPSTPPAAVFAAFDRANALLAGGRAAMGADGGRYLAEVAAWADWDGKGPANDPAPPVEAPVFFVGFPRSGTTLMENILAAHPGIATTDESSPLVAAEIVLQQRLGAAYPARLAEASADDLAAARAAFSAKTEAVTGGLDGRTLLDKLPLNIARLGLARVLYPNAKAIVALRDPRDVVLSCYQQRFAPNDAMMNFTDIRRGAKAYAAVMGGWREAEARIAMPTLVYRYEDLVDDVPGTTARLLAFIGLDWDEALETWQDRARTRDIGTPSYARVTEKVSRRAVGRWRRYAEPMAPALETLTPFVAAFGYDG